MAAQLCMLWWFPSIGSRPDGPHHLQPQQPGPRARSTPACKAARFPSLPAGPQPARPSACNALRLQGQGLRQLEEERAQRLGQWRSSVHKDRQAEAEQPGSHPAAPQLQQQASRGWPWGGATHAVALQRLADPEQQPAGPAVSLEGFPTLRQGLRETLLEWCWAALLFKTCSKLCPTAVHVLLKSEISCARSAPTKMHSCLQDASRRHDPANPSQCQSEASCSQISTVGACGAAQPAS